MTPETGDPKPTTPARSRWANLPGPLAGFAVAAVLFWLHSGGDTTGLGEPVDFSWLVVAAVWLGCLVVLIVKGAAWAQSRPLRLLWTGLPPAAIALCLSSLVVGQLPLGPDPAENCDFLWLSAFLGERARFMGFLATGSLWLGSIWRMNPQAIGGDRQEQKRVIWIWPVAIVLFSGAVLWTFLDPATPSRVRASDFSVRGLWVLLACGVALFSWARRWSRGQPRRMLLDFATLLGVILLGLGVISYHRMIGFYLMAHQPEAYPVDLRTGAGVVAATCLLRSSPFMLLAVLAGLFSGLVRQSPRDMKRLGALALALLAAAGFGVGSEVMFRNLHDQACRWALPEGFELPYGRPGEEVGEGPLMVVTEEGVFLDGTPVTPDKGGKFPVDAPKDRGPFTLRLAVDRRILFEPLYRSLRSAAFAGWCTFRMVIRTKPADQHPCYREQRLFGVCLKEPLAGIPFELACMPGSIGRLGDPPPPAGDLTANLIVEADRMELTFGGFGPSTETLDSLAREIPDRFGVRDLETLESALRKAKERFPESTRLILLPQPELLTVEELVPLMERIRGFPGKPLFPELVFSQLVR